MDPGWCYSEVMREWSGLKLAMFKIFRAIFARSTEVGSRTILANAEAGEESHGQYYDNCSLGRLSGFVLSDEGAATQKKVWVQLAEILEKIEPGILGNI